MFLNDLCSWECDNWGLYKRRTSFTFFDSALQTSSAITVARFSVMSEFSGPGCGSTPPICSSLFWVCFESSIISNPISTKICSFQDPLSTVVLISHVSCSRSSTRCSGAGRVFFGLPAFHLPILDRYCSIDIPIVKYEL